MVLFTRADDFHYFCCFFLLTSRKNLLVVSILLITLQEAFPSFRLLAVPIKVVKVVPKTKTEYHVPKLISLKPFLGVARVKRPILSELLCISHFQLCH
jgi:hypothetical protein